jgi:hypothetical protein
MAPVTCAEIPITSCQSLPRNTSGEQMSQLHPGGSLKPHKSYGLPKSIIKRCWHDMLKVISNPLSQTGTGCSVITRQPPVSEHVDSLFSESCYEVKMVNN